MNTRPGPGTSATAWALPGLLLLALLFLPGLAPRAASPTPALAVRPVVQDAQEQDPAAYRADLETFYARLRELHPDPYRVTSQEEWDAAHRALSEDLEDASFAEFVVGISAFAALAADGHTNFLPFWVPTPGFEQKLPVRFEAFEGGVYITHATPEAEALLGGRVVSVNGHPVRDVLRKLATLIGADNPQWALRWTPTLLQIPLYLEGAGLGAQEAPGAPSPRRPVVLQVEMPTGELVELPLETVDADAVRWVDARDTLGKPTDALPRFGTQRAFDFVHWPDRSCVYAIYNEVADEEDETVAQFAARLFDFIETHEVERLILDMRDNGGGNNYLSQPLLHGMIGSRVNRPGGLFVLVGRRTFSAAMNLVTRMERHTQALFTGEPTGAAPNHCGDPEFVQLPESGLSCIVSTLQWQDSQPDDPRRWIAPDLPVPERFDDWRDRHDAALEAALEFRADATQDITPPIARWLRPSQSAAWPTLLDE